MAASIAGGFAWAQSPATGFELGAVLKQYCFTCHNDKSKTGGLSLERLNLANVPANAEIWEKAIRKVRVGMMPPLNAAHPDDSTRHALVAWLQTELDRAAADKPNPGSPLLHRMNRTEYANAIRDLLALEIDPAALLPPDDSAYGFDNISDALGASPVLLESYLSAAGKISSLAVGDPETGSGAKVFRVRQDASQDVHNDELPIGTVGGLLARVTLPLDGEYLLQTKLYRTNLGAMRGLEYAHQLEITVDGERKHLASFGGEADFKAALENITTAADAVDARFTVRLPLEAGPHAIGVAFLEERSQNTLRLQPFLRSSNDTLDPAGQPHIDTFTITGPFSASGPGDTPSRRKVFTCRPFASSNAASDEEACGRRIVATLVHRAYRGLDTPADLDRLMSFYRAVRRRKNFEAGIQVALERMLASPKFIFRAEKDPPGAAAGSIHPVTGLELASRLSFFLWSTIPDDALLEVAAQGKLRDPKVLETQVRRMLADPKAEALVTNFAGQWLYLRNLRGMVPNSYDFPDFDDNLRQAFVRETELFFGSVLHEDRSVLDLLNANYSFVNERLARHYGIPNVYGSHFRRVTITDPARRGLLGQGAILMVTSHTDRTSPVVRGKWVLDNLLGAPPPPMPANVPPLDENNVASGRVLTMRERMEQHRSNPYCAS
jgi:hypothetical protein